MLADYGISDESFKEVLGTDSELDAAINYYLDADGEEEYWYSEEDEWE